MLKKINNNMARSSYKYTYFTENDLKYHYSWIDPSYYFYESNSRYKTLNRWNMPSAFNIHQGKTQNYMYTDKHCLRTKLGMYSKTRKPFFFRSKIKKK